MDKHVEEKSLTVVREFYIKWKLCSYRRCSWVREEILKRAGQHLPGVRRRLDFFLVPVIS